MQRQLLHLLSPRDYPPEYPIRPGKEGFIHLCSPEQAQTVLTRFFEGGPAYALLIDPVLEPCIRDEDSYGHGVYPHLYGNLTQQHVLACFEIDAQHSVPEATRQARKTSSSSG